MQEAFFRLSHRYRCEGRKILQPDCPDLLQALRDCRFDEIHKLGSGETVVAKRRQTDPQPDLPFLHSADTRRTLEIHCGNCGARLIAFYGSDEDAATETVG